MRSDFSAVNYHKDSYYDEKDQHNKDKQPNHLPRFTELYYNIVVKLCEYRRIITKIWQYSLNICFGGLSAEEKG